MRTRREISQGLWLLELQPRKEGPVPGGSQSGQGSWACAGHLIGEAEEGQASRNRGVDGVGDGKAGHVSLSERNSVSWRGGQSGWGERMGLDKEFCCLLENLRQR